MSAARPQFLALVGATATGKTEVALRIAERVHAEVVSMDSRQVYRGMDIGTAKASASERARVPHHGLDLVTPAERYSAGRFARDARLWIGEIRARGHLPLLVGGTGFFLRAVTDPIFAEPPLDPTRLDALRGWMRAQSRDLLERWVEALDPERAALAREGGPQRLSRTLEVALLSGRPLSSWHRASPAEAEGLPGVIVVLDLPRDEIDRRIEARTRAMVDAGWVDEVRALLDAGYDADAPGMTGTGYREIAAYVRGEVSLEDAIEAVRVSTRQYARRQLTWFRHQLPDSAVRLDATVPGEELADLALAAYERAGGALSRAQHEVGT
ncbi:MAG: tRNA (adenosine(37)-N6)-dimethylallyltransferase MiaA [Longimicrobiales bacterium]